MCMQMSSYKENHRIVTATTAQATPTARHRAQHESTPLTGAPRTAHAQRDGAAPRENKNELRRSLQEVWVGANDLITWKSCALACPTRVP